MKRNLRLFTANGSFSRTKPFSLLLWVPFQHVFFKSFLFPSRLRPRVLTVFGASIGSRVIIRRGVRVQFPWKLTIGSDCWIGEEVWFINHEKVTIGNDVCVSQQSMICSGGHDYRSPSLEYAHKPIEIKDGAWICLDAKVLPGVTIGECSVVSAGEVARKSLPDFSMLIGGQIRPIEPPR